MDELDKVPLDSPSDVTFISTEAELESAVTACYNKLWGPVQLMPYHLVFDMTSDIGWDRDGSHLQAIGNGNHDSRNTVAEYMWTNLYTGIYRCNYVLANMDRAINEVSPNIFETKKAEVRFLRALFYHYLIELYGDVPLVQSPVSLEESQMARDSKEEVVNFVLDELNESAQNLPLENNPLLGRANRLTAWALASRVALYNGRWQVCIEQAQKVMSLEGTQVELSSDYNQLFHYSGEAKKEILLSAQYLLAANSTQALTFAFGSRNARGVSNKVPTYQLADSWECTDGLQIDESPLYDPLSPYKNRDPRLGYTLALSGSQFLGFQFQTHGDSLNCWNYGVSPAVRIPNNDATHPYATFTGICWRKYTNVEDLSNIQRSELNTIIIRYAEVLLNYAEAKIENNDIDQSVLDAINKVRQRPSVNMPPINLNSQADLRNAVRRERKYELTGEGTRLFDIRRWRIAEEVMNEPVLGRMKKAYPSISPSVDALGTSHYTNIPIALPGESSDFKMRTVEVRKFNPSRDYLWPIPQVEIQTNSLMTQNPGY